MAMVNNRQGQTVELPGGITAIDHYFTLPLSYQSVDTRKIEVFARELVLTKQKNVGDKPYLLFLQGGPGFCSPRVQGVSGWCGKALQEYRVILLDQRGTGKSTAINAASLARLPSPAAQAEYLTHFRLDNIVEDCEAIREILLDGKGGTEGARTPGKWTLLGQSYGGFCILRYLSAYPKSLNACLFTVGLPPIEASAEDVYRSTYIRLAERNRRYYQRYPGDVEKVKAIIQHIEESPEKFVMLPSGGRLTSRRFLQLGLSFGFNGGFESLHYLIDEAFEHPLNLNTGETPALSYNFLKSVDSAQAFDTNVIYSLLHESIYCQGKEASKWAAERVLNEEGSQVQQMFDFGTTLPSERPVYFLGEMIFSWMFDGDYEQLSGLKEAAQILAEKKDWPQIYSRGALQKANVPCAALVSYDDMYVDRVFSEETSRVLPNCKVWITNKYQHSGLRDDGVVIFDTLTGMIKDEVNIPS